LRRLTRACDSAELSEASVDVQDELDPLVAVFCKADC
jgi:hypothetical protein